MLSLGPGDCRFTDYARVGLPLQIIFLLASLVVVPSLFPF